MLFVIESPSTGSVAATARGTTHWAGPKPAAACHNHQLCAPASGCPPTVPSSSLETRCASEAGGSMLCRRAMEKRSCTDSRGRTGWRVCQLVGASQHATHGLPACGPPSRHILATTQHFRTCHYRTGREAGLESQDEQQQGQQLHSAAPTVPIRVFLA